MQPRILVVDYGLGNLGSVMKGFRQVGAEVGLSRDPAELLAADALVLPGDGAFGATMDEIRGRGLVDVLLESARAGTPLLGICIGMQVLFEESEEHGRHAGLGLLPGRVRRFFGEPPEGSGAQPRSGASPRGPSAGIHFRREPPEAQDLPVPHMGWNRLWRRQEHALLEGLPDGAHVYFVHSYFCDAPAEVVVATAQYGREFAAIVGRGNVLGMQFHPEKSQAVGLRLIENFVLDVAARAGRRSSALAGRSA